MKIRFNGKWVVFKDQHINGLLEELRVAGDGGTTLRGILGIDV